MKRALRPLMRSDSAATAAEFAMVLPVLLILLFGIIDTGRFLYEYNEAEKATQVGARVAIVTNVLSPELRDENYVGQTVGGKVIGPGDRIPAGALGTVLCTSASCTCAAGPCPSGVGTVDTATFNDILVARMQQIYPAIQPDNVQVRYSGSGLGIAADPVGGSGGAEQMQISPLITVTLTGVDFHPITSLMFATIGMPSFSTTLTAEDASGSYSN
ncbi:TadE/TadG family type IV pilus assembly protein [Sphingomonas alba]|uniref:Pilus assembly protein n=1 Tax=Sphingomonas alba TaxID=2908208 RepID=A0ABT0RPC5_9SPHN|nr:TadE family protein [Sphingomonas alba]MCL6684506.1 pilus assembly protein [Sphingomonas alba]